MNGESFKSGDEARKTEWDSLSDDEFRNFRGPNFREPTPLPPNYREPTPQPPKEPTPLPPELKPKEPEVLEPPEPESNGRPEPTEPESNGRPEPTETPTPRPEEAFGTNPASESTESIPEDDTTREDPGTPAI